MSSLNPPLTHQTGDATTKNYMEADWVTFVISSNILPGVFELVRFIVDYYFQEFPLRYKEK